MPDPQTPDAQDARTAAQLDADVGAAQIAAVYAQALLGAAEATGQTDAVMADFDAVVDAALSPRFESVLGSALIPHEEKAALLDRVFGGRVSPLLLNALKVLSQHGRLDLLRHVHREAAKQYDVLRGRVRVKVTTAEPVDAALLARLSERLATKTGGVPAIEQVVDPAVIGGAVIRIGDTVYDGSVANQLKMLRQQMMERSAHEIQSRRDRFRHSAGN